MNILITILPQMYWWSWLMIKKIVIVTYAIFVLLVIFEKLYWLIISNLNWKLNRIFENVNLLILSLIPIETCNSEADGRWFLCFTFLNICIKHVPCLSFKRNQFLKALWLNVVQWMSLEIVTCFASSCVNQV